MTRFFSILFLLFAWLGAELVCAQRVQFPSAAPNITPPTYNPTPQPVLPSFDPYGNPLLGTPPPDVPYNVSPQFAPQISPPVAGPSTAPGSFVAPPPVAQPGIPQQGGSIYPNGLPFQWESGAYQHQNSDGTVARLQRLLQQISAEHTWIYGNDTVDALEINRTEIAATFGVPIFYNPDTPLLITPGFAFNWLDGPIFVDPNDPNTPGAGADLPPRVYDAYLDFAWHPQLTDWLSADLGVRTGVWTDFEEVNSDSIRILGRGLGVVSLTPQFDFLVGVWYLDRNRVTLLPAGGVHWRPSPELDAYLVFPNPKIRKRWINFGPSQWWLYASGEYGGGRWTIERMDGRGDDFDYNDVRVILGAEWETQTQMHGFIEVGYVFARELIYDGTKDPFDFNLDSSIMVRTGFDL